MTENDISATQIVNILKKHDDAVPIGFVATKLSSSSTNVKNRLNEIKDIVEIIDDKVKLKR
jgi:multidrug efflux pump subunit AcrB